MADDCYQLNWARNARLCKDNHRESPVYGGAPVGAKTYASLKGGLCPLKGKKEDLVALLRDMRDIVIDVLNNNYEQRKIYFTAQQEPIVFSFDSFLLHCGLYNLIYNTIVQNPADTEIHIFIEKQRRSMWKYRITEKVFPKKNWQICLGGTAGAPVPGKSARFRSWAGIAKQIVAIHGGTI